MPSCGFNIHYTLQLHLKYPCQVKPHKVYHHRTILQLVHCMQIVPSPNKTISITKMCSSARESYISFSLHTLRLILHFITLYQATQKLPSSLNTGNIQFPSGIKTKFGPTFYVLYLRDTTTVPFIVVGCNLLQHL